MSQEEPSGPQLAKPPLAEGEDAFDDTHFDVSTNNRNFKSRASGNCEPVIGLAPRRLSMWKLAGYEYQSIDESGQLAGLTVAMIDDVLAKRFEIGETPLIGGFRQSLE